MFFKDYVSSLVFVFFLYCFVVFIVWLFFVFGPFICLWSTGFLMYASYWLAFFVWYSSWSRSILVVFRKFWVCCCWLLFSAAGYGALGLLHSISDFLLVTRWVCFDFLVSVGGWLVIFLVLFV